MKQIRRRASAQFWAGHIKEFQAKPEDNKRDYCKRNGLVYHQFLYWLEKHEGKAKVESEPSEKWIGLVTEQTRLPELNCHCEFEFKNGTKLKLQSEESLEMLVPLIQMMAC